ncbi:MAG TPA: tripartite tricarboxylate transporter substrate binding protein [Usitatibacter sp.]|jgi:tripartite-type tricarboxylate transporter receptor subunit TctC|nr:tripartite tricarboxylate transporter substrate binding protein [Usitatibacter sp.]
MKIVKRVAAALCVAVSCAAGAQQFPSRPVHIVVPFAPGGNLDVTARLIGESMSKTLGQPFVIDNRAGAGGAVGQEAVARAAPDGYTLVAATPGTTIVSPLMIPTPPYSRADFAPVGIMAVTPLLLEVPAASPYPDFKSYVAAVKANPGKVTIGHSGNGTTNHIAILELQEALKVRFNIVPYKGSGPALVDLIGGQIDSMVDQTSSSLPHIRAGKLRALAVGTPERLPDLPDVPTLQEEGVKDFEATTPSALLAPAKTPPDVIRVLNDALGKALADPAVRAKLKGLGSGIRSTTPGELDAFMRGEEKKLKALHEQGVLKGG